MRNRLARRIEVALGRWGLTARAAGVAVVVGFYLPWCSNLTGAQLAQAKNYGSLWLFLVAGVILILVPLLRRHPWRPHLEILLGTGILIATLYIAWRLGRARSTGIYVTGLGGLIAAVGGVLLSASRKHSVQVDKPESGP